MNERFDPKVYPEDDKLYKNIRDKLELAPNRFKVVIVILDKEADPPSLGDDTFEKAVILYQRPVNIAKAQKLRDTLVTKEVTEIKDFFFNEKIGDDIINDVKGTLSIWNTPLSKDKKTALERGQYIKLPKEKGKDSPVHLYASAMIGAMGQLLLKLDNITSDYVNFIIKNYCKEQTDESSNPNSAPYGDTKEKTSPATLKNQKNSIACALKGVPGNNKKTFPTLDSAPPLPKILLIGDSGVGKSLVANFIHHKVQEKLKDYFPKGDNSTRPVRVGIPEFLGKEDDFEFRLFGYAKGAFTGGKEDGDLGVLMQNLGQVVFLDEIGTASSVIQEKLLTYLDDYKVSPRGWTQDPFFCPILIVAATNERGKLADSKQFRNDLLQRFTARLEIPNLKDRIAEKEENLLYLLDCIIQVDNINPEPSIEKIGKDAFQLLFNHFSKGSQGNFRELENLMREVCAIARDDKRNYVVKDDLTKAMTNLHLDNSTFPIPTKQEVTPEPTAEIIDYSKTFEDFCKKNHSGLDGKAKEKIYNSIKDNPELGYHRIINEKQLTDVKSSAVQRLDKAIRNYLGCDFPRKTASKKTP